MAEDTPKMKLEQVPELLDQLITSGSITEAQKKRVLEVRKMEPAGKARFVGQIAVDEGMVKQEQLNAALLAQATAKGKAAEEDLKTISTSLSDGGGHQNHAQWLEANWGNKGVNRATNKPSVTVAGSAAIANTAQNIVILANDENPALAKDKDVQAGVKAAFRLTRFIAGESDERLGEKEASALRDTAMKALRKAAKGVELLDKQHKPIDLESFIKEREKEITDGITERVNARRQPPAKRPDGPTPTPWDKALPTPGVNQR